MKIYSSLGVVLKSIMLIVNMRKPALKLVKNNLLQSLPYVDLPKNDIGLSSPYSLSRLLSSFSGVSVELASFLISKYAQRGMKVFDPFCGSGTVALEALFSGCDCIVADTNKFSTFITKSKLNPADLTEVALRLQQFNLRKPVSLTNFRDIFSAFYDPTTYCEIVNLRNELISNPDRINNFISLLVTCILHGSNAGSLSAYSYQKFALSPAEQSLLNLQRGQVPDYRPLMPRILRKVAMALRDVNSGSFSEMEIAAPRLIRDQRDLSFVKDQEIDITITAPPYPGKNIFTDKNWIREWFVDMPVAEQNSPAMLSQSAWIDYMNEFLFELARVTADGGKALLCFEASSKYETSYDKETFEIVQNSLNKYWYPEKLLIDPISTNSDPAFKKDSSLACKRRPRTCVLVLRRQI